MTDKGKNAKLIGNLAPNDKWQGKVVRSWAQVYSIEAAVPCLPSMYANHSFKIVDDR